MEVISTAMSKDQMEQLHTGNYKTISKVAERFWSVPRQRSKSLISCRRTCPPHVDKHSQRWLLHFSWLFQCLLSHKARKSNRHYVFGQRREKGHFG